MIAVGVALALALITGALALSADGAASLFGGTPTTCRSWSRPFAMAAAAFWSPSPPSCSTRRS